MNLSEHFTKASMQLLTELFSKFPAPINVKPLGGGGGRPGIGGAF